MNKYSKYLLIFGVGAMALTSCNMEELPKTAISYVEGENMIQSIDDLTRLANGLNQSYRVTHYGQISEAEEVMCDGFNATVDYGNNFGSIHRTDDSFTASDYDTRDMWAINYWAIKNYNVFIENVEKFNGETADEQAKANVADGIAHFYRASSYLQLVRHFGKAYGNTSSSDLAVPLVLKYNQEEKPSRATVADVYAQIKADLDIAASKLSGVAGKIGSLTPTIDAVNALYARYYLDIKDYSNAATFAQKVISSAAGYKLASTIEEMDAEYTNDAGTEPIMQLASTLAESGAAEVFDNVENDLVNDIYTLTTSDKTYGIYARPYYLPSKKLVDSYEETDLRFQTWFSNAFTVVLGGGNLTGKFYTFVKYLGNPALTSTGIPNARQHIKPFLIGEMYLIAAEANFRNDNAANAKTLLNTLQAARGASQTEATEDAIENEWFKETVGEGLRMNCFKRWGKGFSGRAAQEGAVSSAAVQTGGSFVNKSMDASDYHWQWPVPTYELQVNENLVQNPGY
jgi:hypothetical protein